MVAHACKSSNLGGRDEKYFEATLGKKQDPVSKNKAGMVGT
jgi:hypothetical protein